MMALLYKMKKKTMILTVVWTVLISLTLFSAFVAEQTELTTFIVVLICVVVSIKGLLVIEHLMGLNVAAPSIRWLMLSYFFVLPPIIALSVVFPETLARLTTL